MNKLLLCVDQLGLGAAGRTLISGLHFQVSASERWVVIGRNAAGKSTLLRALAGLAVPVQSGHVNWPDHSTRERDVSRRRAYLAQQSSDRFDLTVQEFLQLHRPPSEAPLCQQPDAALDVAHLLERPITQLSGGERQRVGLAAVAQQSVPMWLLDEPVSFQDPAHQQQVGAWLCAQHDVGMVITAHDMNWVSQVATHVIAVLPGEGQVITGTRDQVLTASNLAQTFGCEWVCLQGRWLPTDL
jgi:iron complex transport system ATP-binding protein